MSQHIERLGVDRRSFLRGAAAAGVLSLSRLGAADRVAEAGSNGPPPVRVRLWCEATAPRSVYPDDIDGALARHLGRQNGLHVSRARLADPAAGLSDSALEQTDVLVWWGRLRHDDVPADRVAAVVSRVRSGKLGFLALHSSWASRPFRGLLGGSCEPGEWREDGQPEHVRIEAPSHPIARGLNAFTIPRTDMFAEPFAVPTPETVVLVSAWDKGESVRSGMTWSVERGRVVYLRSGPDSFPVLFHSAVRQAITNAVFWAARRT